MRRNHDRINRGLLGLLLGVLLMTGCSADGTETTGLLVASAASLKGAMEEIGTMYIEENPHITIAHTFGGSGTLQQQIEQGAPVDIFMSAATKQMAALEDKGLVLDHTKKELLENKVVLIQPKETEIEINSFEDILKIDTIALGEPASVPVGQYSEEIFTTLGILEAVKGKVTYATDVTEVLTWVETGNVGAGVVYATDAATSDKINVVAEAPEGSYSKVVYPVAVIKDTKISEEAKAFVDYLGTNQALEVFVKYGFVINQ